MIKKTIHNTIFFIFVLLFFHLPTFAIGFFNQDARTLSMGGGSTAYSKPAAGAFINPALMIDQTNYNSTNLLVPMIGLTVVNDEGITNFIEEGTFDRFDDTINIIDNNVDRIENIFEQADSIVVDYDNGQDLNLEALADIDELQALLKGDCVGGAATCEDNLRLPNGLTQEVILLNANAERLSVDGDALTKALRKNLQDELEGTINLGGSFVSSTGRKQAFGFYVHNNTFLGGKIDINDQDLELIDHYVTAAEAYSVVTENYGITLSDFVDATQAAQQAIANFSSGAVSGGNPDQLLEDLNAAALRLDQATEAFRAAEEDYKTFQYGAREGEGDTLIFSEGRYVDSDPTSLSTAQLIGLRMTEFGISFAHQFKLSNQKIRFGVTPKYQQITVYDYVYKVLEEELDFDDVLDSEQTYDVLNVDLGFATTFGHKKNWHLGLSLKNLLSKTYESPLNNEISVDTEIRLGGAYTSNRFTLTTDLDLIENKPLAFEQGTQYFSLGGEVNFFKKLLSARMGYRLNLANTDQPALFTGGLGLYIKGFSADVSVVNAENAYGGIFQAGYRY